MAVTIHHVANEQKNQISQETADFELLFEEHWTRVYGLIYRMTGDPDEAEDLALETFWRLYSQPPRHTENTGGWLYRVALRLGYNSLRSTRRRQRYEQVAGRMELEEGLPNPEDQVSLSEQHEQVRGVLAGMKPRSAEILILRHSGFSYQEIAKILGIQASSVGTLLARAEKEFRIRYSAFG